MREVENSVQTAIVKFESGNYSLIRYTYGTPFIGPCLETAVLYFSATWRQPNLVWLHAQPAKIGQFVFNGPSETENNLRKWRCRRRVVLKKCIKMITMNLICMNMYKAKISASKVRIWRYYLVCCSVFICSSVRDVGGRSQYSYMSFTKIRSINFISSLIFYGEKWHRAALRTCSTWMTRTNNKYLSSFQDDGSGWFLVGAGKQSIPSSFSVYAFDVFDVYL